MDTDTQLQPLLLMVEESLGATGLVAAMGERERDVRLDIPAATAMLSLLHAHLLEDQALLFSPAQGPHVCRPGLWTRPGSAQYVLHLSAGQGELGMLSYEAAAAIPSARVRALPGLLSFGFSCGPAPGEPLEKSRLWPEWWAMFYVDSLPEHGVPILMLRSILSREQVGDWVSLALERMSLFGLPCAAAQEAASTVVAKR